MLGALCLLVLGSGPSCRKDPAPQIILCQGDGAGGADCDIPPGVDPDHPEGGKFYWSPTQLNNAWITTQGDAARLLAWCYQTTDVEAVKQAMKFKKLNPCQLTESTDECIAGPIPTKPRGY